MWQWYGQTAPEFPAEIKDILIKKNFTENLSILTTVIILEVAFHKFHCRYFSKLSRILMEVTF